MSEETYIPRSRLNGRPLFYCEACGDLTGLETTDGQVLKCSVCGWELVLISEKEMLENDRDKTRSH
jgi:hypothetical protein